VVAPIFSQPSKCPRAPAGLAVVLNAVGALLLCVMPSVAAPVHWQPGPIVAQASGSSATATMIADEAAWQKAIATATLAAFRDYLKAFPTGEHTQEAQLQIVDLILAAAAEKSNGFDGTWRTTFTCPNVGQVPGFSYKFPASVADGAYHAQKGKTGERNSLGLDGRIEPDGTAAFIGKGVVGLSILASGAPPGSAYSFHASAQFGAKSGVGKRIEGRPCILKFVKQ
jgi:hypothetical protein